MKSKNQSGSISLVELALLVALVSIVGIAFITALGADDARTERQLESTLDQSITVDFDQHSLTYTKWATVDGQEVDVACFQRYETPAEGPAHPIGSLVCLDSLGNPTQS